MDWKAGIELMEKLQKEKATKEQYFSFLKDKGCCLEEEEVIFSDFNISAFLKHHKKLNNLKHKGWYWIKKFNNSEYEIAVFSDNEFTTVGSESVIQKEDVYFIDPVEVVRGE